MGMGFLGYILALRSSRVGGLCGQRVLGLGVLVSGDLRVFQAFNTIHVSWEHTTK